MPKVVPINPVYLNCQEGPQKRIGDAQTRVLIVEPNLSSRMTLLTLLEQFGLESDIAVDKNEAFSCVVQRLAIYDSSYQLILVGQIADQNTIYAYFDTVHLITEYLKANLFTHDYEQAIRVGGKIKPYICLMLSSKQNTHKIIKSAKTYGVDECVSKPIFKAEIQKLLVKSGLTNN